MAEQRLYFQLESSSEWFYTDYEPSSRLMAKLADAVHTGRQRGVEFAIVVLPMSEYELELIRQKGLWERFMQWKRDLLQAGSYWDFSGDSKLARTDRLFHDLEHLRPPAGQVVLRHVLGDDCARCGDSARLVLDAAFRVDPATIERHLASQETEQRSDARRAAIVARAIALAQASEPPR